MIRGDVWSFQLWVTFWDVMVAYGAFGLFVLTIRSFDGCFGRITRSRSAITRCRGRCQVLGRRESRSPASAGAIVTWVNYLEPQSLSFEGLIGLARVPVADHGRPVYAARRGDVCRACRRAPTSGGGHIGMLVASGSACAGAGARPRVDRPRPGDGRVAAARVPSPTLPVFLPAVGPLHVGLSA